ncbi:MAG: cation diffusion facilitator family transporter [Hydrogenobaculum sp.]
MKKYHWSIISIFLMLLLAIIKLGVGFLSKSVALKAEGIHSLSDSLASFIGFISIYMSEKKHEKFPYGLYKLENIGAMFISFFLFFAAYDMFMDVLFGHYKIDRQYISWGLGVGIISMLITFGFSVLERIAAKKHNSPALMADSEHMLVDGFGSFVITLNFLSLEFNINLDKIFASVIILLIIYTGFHILKEQIFVILDASVDSKMIEHIKDIILQDPRVKSIKRLLVRKSGDKIFIDAAISIKSHNFNQSHAVADDIEEAITRVFPQTEMVFIHYEPDESPENTRIAVLTFQDEVSDFKNVDMIHIYDNFVLTFVLKAKDDKDKKEDITATDIAQVKSDFVIATNHPKSNRAKWTLHKYGVFIWETENKNIQKALDEIKAFSKD